MNIWGACKACKAPNAVDDAAKLIDKFCRQHKRTITGEGRYASRTEWVDDANLKFDHRGERHGPAPFPRGWKYSFEGEEGFHYDVEHFSKRPFNITGALAKRAITAGDYVNIDCHGYFRGEAGN